MGTATVTDAIRVDWDHPVVTSQASSSGNILSGISIRNLKYVHGIALGTRTQNYQDDNIVIEKCVVTSSGSWTPGETTWWQAGFATGDGFSGNVLNHYYSNVFAAYNRYNFLFNGGCNASVTNFDSGHAEVDFYAIGGSTLSIRNGRSESSTRLYEEPGGASYGRDVSFADVLWTSADLNGDNHVIVKGYTGSLSLENVFITQLSAAPNIYVSNAAGRRTGVFLQGVTSRTAAASFVIANGTSQIAINNQNYNVINSSGQIDDVLNYEARVN
mgnify:FL=1